VLDGVYLSWLTHTYFRMKKRGLRLPQRPSWSDVFLVGLATHKLSLILSKEWSTAPLRAPFTQFEAIESGGELNETSRGTGMQEAIGDLLTCPYCLGVWVATGLSINLVNSPALTRLFAGILGSVAISDFLHSFYEKFSNLPPHAPVGHSPHPVAEL
jgi:hypothetical protein